MQPLILGQVVADVYHALGTRCPLPALALDALHCEEPDQMFGVLFRPLRIDHDEPLHLLALHTGIDRHALEVLGIH